MHPITQLTIFKLLIVQHCIITVCSFHRSKLNKSMIYEIFNSHIVLNSFTEKLALSQNGDSSEDRKQAYVNAELFAYRPF